MKGLLVAATVIVALYVVDQNFENGKYTDAVLRLVAQLRHSFGI